MDTTNYKRTVAGSVGAGLGAIFNATGRTYYILEHKTNSKYHNAGESQKIIVDQIELGRDSSCQVRFDEAFTTVSRKHAAIVRDGAAWKIVALSTTNVTLVNGTPVQGEKVLASGDEIRLSHQGPVIGFIMPQGAQSMVKSIGLTERMNLFRKQALRPYKTAIWILFIVLILAVGGLVTWNVLQSKSYEEKLLNMQYEQELIYEQMVAKDAEISALMEKLDNAETRANMTAAEVRKANEAIRQYESEKAELERRQEEIAASISELNRKVESAPAKQKKSAGRKQEVKEEPADKENRETPVAVEVQEQDPAASQPAESQTSISSESDASVDGVASCNNAVFAIKITDIVIYDPDGKELSRLKADNIAGGTGFLLEDGRLMTAHRVVAPWYYGSGQEIIGKDDIGVQWKMSDVQIIGNKGCKVVADITATSPDGLVLKFKNTDMTAGYDFAGDEANAAGVEVKKTTVNRVIFRQYRVQSGEMRNYDGAVDTDWMYINLAGQFSDRMALATAPVPSAGTEVFILGYAGGNAPASVTDNVAGIADNGVIELARRKSKDGNEGAPVLVQDGDGWAVIGILSGSDSAASDVVVPVGKTR